ncbi:helix-turn-helix domain-containing protein [Paenibacillus lemnae]|uniref:AraC family transcriptional regulator n=1 Tax=Paenibacillus lemnae TaxID=1330551 RepID=A0A848MAC3_PAELE|nr:helix-turn-helix domain-containing protein [Paenibacillus lemnae]NMO96424.1 AraC family transcriptional regulator [Paenibacillus lemnae]
MKQVIDSIRVNKFFGKILFSFLSFLIPLVVLGTLTYTNFVSELKADYADKLHTALTSSTETVNAYWQRIHETQVGFFGDPYVARLLKPQKGWSDQDRSNLPQLQASLVRAKFHINSIVDDLFTYVDDEFVLTANGINDFQPFFNKFYRYHGLDSQFWIQKLESVRYVEVMKPVRVDTLFDSKEVITYLSSSQMGDDKAVLAVTVPVKTIWQAFEPILDPGVSKVIVADASGGTVMYSDSLFSNGTALGHIEEASGEQNTSTPVIEVDGSRYMTDQVTMDTLGWTFYTVTPVRAFNQQASGILEFVMSLCLILGIVSLVFAFLFSYRLYTPIRRIGEVLENSSVEEGGTSGAKHARDFRQIGDGVNRLLHHRVQHKGQMELLAQEYLDQVLFQLVQGNVLREDQFENLSKFMQTRLHFKENGFLCCTVSMKFKERFITDIQDVDRIVIENKMKNLFYGLLREYACLYVLETGESSYLCVFNVKDSKAAVQVKKGMEQLGGIFSNDWTYCRLHIGMGTTHQGVEGIAESYQEAVSALYQIEGDPDFSVMEFNDKASCHEWIYTYAEENRLLQLLRFGDKAGVSDWVEEMTEQHKEAYYSLNKLYDKMFETGRRFMLERNHDADQWIAEEHPSVLGKTGTIKGSPEERKQVLIQFLHHAMDQVSEAFKPQKSSDLAAAIKTYVEENFTQDLHLEKISEEMGLSLKYVSRLFKESYNMNITGFISELRVEKAKELLRDTDLPITAVSKQVGIFDRTTFLRTFKRLEGVSPNDYRKQIRA